MSLSQQKLLDLIYREFPSVLETEARTRINQALNDFCEQTLLFRKDVTVTITADTTAYDLDASIIRVDEVVSGTDVFTPLQKSPENYTKAESNVYWIQGDTIHIGDVSAGALTALDAGDTVTLRTRALLDDLNQYVQLLDSGGNPLYDSNGDPLYTVAASYISGPDIASQFHEAPVWRVLSDLYLGNTQLPVHERLAMSRAYMGRYDDVVRKAKMAAGRGHRGQGFTTTLHWY